MNGLKNITAGPSKYELSCALFLKPRNENAFPVTFTLEGDEKLEISSILGVAVEDGSRESWLVTGYVKGFSKHVTFYYETRRMTGTITLPTD
jgi:hypothetical protein